MSARGPRLEFAVGAFLLLALGSLLVLAIASTNGQYGFGADTYPLKARFTNLGQLRPMAPVKIGGVPIGKYIAAKAVYKRQILELGGNDPIVVMDDADIAKAADLAASGSYKNSGQRCTAVKRILVHEKIAPEFTDALLARTRAWTYGDPLDPNVDMGTVIDERSATLFETRVADAVAQGARLLYGNQRAGASYSPTLIDRVRGEMEVVQQETFGPVSPVMTFKNLDDVIAQVNSTAFGLSSGICTNRLDDIMRFVKEANVGSVNVWEVPGYRLEVTPFGGIKDSGLGIKEGVQECCKAFTNVKTYSLPW